MHSIRFFLVASILATLILFNFIAALQGYQSSMEEADELFDNQLQDIAELVVNLDTDAAVSAISLENDMMFQLWQGSHLLAASANAPGEAISDFVAGFNYVNFDGYRWRTLVQDDPATERWVVIAERTDLRFILAERVVLESVTPILLGIPLVGLLIWSIVSLGLRPLKTLSSELKGKQAHDLSPISHENSIKELEQVIESTNGFISRLSDVLEREKRFSADAAHELRTPISALKIQLHNLRDEIDPQNESYQQLQSGVERMQHLIEQLLSLYRTTPEKFAQNCHQLDLYAIVQEQIAQMYSSFEDKNQTLELVGDSAQIEGDQFALETMISNLLNNANKYTPVDGNILVRIEASPSEVVLIVADSGPGILPEDRLRIFDRFYRADFTTDATRQPGCGLGLTIVAHIAELHHARVDLEDSEFKTGSAFRITFPKESAQGLRA